MFRRYCSSGLSLKKRKIIKLLKQTSYTVCNQLPNSDMDDHGYNANGEFLKFFVDNCQGMIYADEEGFYEKNEIIFKNR